MVRRRQPDPELGRPEANRGRAAGRWTVGVLVGSAAETFAAEQGGPNVRVVRFDGATDAMTAVQNGQYDATLQDLPAARFYAERFPGLELVGPPESHGYYVIYVRTRRPRAPRRPGPGPGAADRRRASCGGSTSVTASGPRPRPSCPTIAGPDRADGRHAEPTAAGRCCGRYLPRLLDAAFVTIVLSVTSMPLAMALGPVHRDRPALRAAAARRRCCPATSS